MAGEPLLVPTVRQLSRQMIVDDAELLTALQAKGVRHANDLLRFDVQAVIDMLDPGVDYTQADIEEAYHVTSFFNLDGMDEYSARHLYNDESIESLSELGQQSQATIATILGTLTGTPHNRPSELEDQDHERRWPLEARMITQGDAPETLRAHPTRWFPIPVHPRAIDAVREFYEGVARDPGKSETQKQAAEVLERTHLLMALFVRGNRGALGGGDGRGYRGASSLPTRRPSTRRRPRGSVHGR